MSIAYCLSLLTILTIISGDDDGERRTQGEVLLNAYSRELERRRLSAGAQGLLISGEGDWVYFPMGKKCITHVALD